MRIGFAVCSLALLAGCYDPVYGLAKDTGIVVEPPTTTTTPPVCPSTTTAAPTYDCDVAPILSATCATSSCHDAGGTSPTLSGAYDTVVGPTAASGMPLITPSDPDQSYLWLKIDGCPTPDCSGSPMPLVGELTADETATILDWITAGAPQ